MMRWVVTGPVGAGKSLFTSELARLGAGVVDGDQLGHEILERTDIISAIGAEFGLKYTTDGVVDRAALGRLVFGEPEKLAALDALTHGPLSELASQRLDALERRGGPPLAVLDAAVYFLLPPVPGIELVVTVTAAEEIRIGRLTAGGVLDLAQATARVHAQRVMTAGWDRADLVLANDGSTADLEHAAGLLWERLEDETCPGANISGVEKRIPPEGAKDS